MPKRKRGLVASLPHKNKPGVSSSRQRGQGECDDAVSVWVQCESEKCQKWRRISSEVASNLKDRPWYCWLNLDARFNSCSASEEKAKKPKHMKFIYSLLPLGEVVTAKLSGYPTWPGLLTQDPTCGEYYDAPLDKETEITHYHVEFFGQPRSRAWLVPALVHPLRSMSEPDKAPQFRNIQGRQLAELKRSYEVALEEARVSLDMAACERLERCHFKYVEENDKPAMSADRVSELTTSLKASQSVTREVRSSSATTPGMSDTIARKNNRNVETSPSWKEKDFLIRFQSFAAERGMTVPKQPVWRGKQISLFDFYNLVLQHGGFENVCRHKLWTKVYNELLQSSVIYGGMSTAARVFYQKNLMPFEHHMRSHTTVDIQFVPGEVSLKPAKRPGRKRSCERKTSCSSLVSLEGEQAVPEVAAVIQNTYHEDGTVDHVPSSNPDSPRRSLGSCSFESDGDESTTSFGCDMVEKELQQLERLLSSLEPSLYPETDGAEFVKVSGSQKEPPSSVFQAEAWNQSLKGVDVLKTLDEMARIEGAIADLNSLVSLELDKL